MKHFGSRACASLLVVLLAGCEIGVEELPGPVAQQPASETFAPTEAAPTAMASAQTVPWCP